MSVQRALSRWASYDELWLFLLREFHYPGGMPVINSRNISSTKHDKIILSIEKLDYEGHFDDAKATKRLKT